jgi:RHS repeat-associated protein
MYDVPSDSYISKSVITLSWYDNLGRKIAEVSPNNYQQAYENLGVGVSDINNYSYYEYNVSGKITKKGFKGYEKKFTAPSTWTDTALVTAKSFTYDYNGNLSTESDVDGANTYTTEYKYSPQGKLISILDPENKLRNIAATVSYEYDTLGRIKKESYVDSTSTSVGLITSYGYTSETVGGVIKTNTVTKKVNTTDIGEVVEINKTDLLGNTIEKTQYKGGVQYTWFYEYNNFGKLSKINEPYKATSTGILQYARKEMKYNYQGELVYRISYITPISQPTSTSIGSSNDVVDLYTVNLMSRKVEIICQQKFFGTEVIIIKASYDKNGNQLTATDANNVVTTYQYDEDNRMTSESVTVGGVARLTKYDYDFNGNVIYVTDWRNNYTKNYYDALNRLYQKENQKYVAYEKLEYNSLGLQVKSYDAYNNCTQFDYDKNKRLIKTTDPRNHAIQTQYDNLGNIKKKIDGRLNEVVYNYDKLGRITDVYDSTVLKASYTYYIDGAIKEQKLGGTYITLYTYFPNGKVDKITDPAEPTPTPSGSYTPTPVPTPLSESYEYNPDETLSKKVDRKGITTNYIYDGHGRLTNQTTVNGSDSIIITIPNTTTDKGYDDNGNLKKIIVEKKVGGTVQSTITTERTYDELNRVKTKTETTVEGGTTTVIGPVTYTYDITTGVSSGEIKEQTVYPGTGNTVEKIYDVTGKLRCVKADGQQTDYTYYNDGRRYTITYNGTFKQTFTYYTDGLLNELTNSIKNTSGVFEESENYLYSYDNAHNMLSKSERIKDPVTSTSTTTSTSYTYDSMNRLWTVTEGTKVTTYTYDSRGNRETVNVNDNGTVTYTKYDFRANNTLKLETIRNGGSGGTIKQKKEYTYDNNGNLTKIDDITGTLKNITTNTYTLLNQLESSTTGTTTLNNRYNAEGYRVSKFVTGNSPTRYFYEGDKVVLEYNNSGTVGAINVIGLNLISRKIGTDKVYYFYNGHGDVTALIHATNNKIRAQYSYDSFGNIKSENYYDSTGALTTDPTKMIKSQVRYSEYQYDPETEYKDASNNTVTGLYYLNARHYDPGTARFLETDTYTGDSSDPLSLNLYTYCHNEPMMYTDPTGHYPGETEYLKDTILSYDPNKYDPEVETLQKDLNFLGSSLKVDGYFGDYTLEAVNAFKDKYLPGGNKEETVRGKVGSTTKLYLKMQVDIKDAVGDYTKVSILNQFNKDLAALSKPKTSVASTTGDAYNNGKSTVKATGINVSPDFIGPIRQQDVRITGGSIRPMTDDEKVREKSALVIKFIPGFSTINNINIATTGLDLYGYGYNEGQRQEAKEQALLDVLLSAFGYAANAVKSGITGLKVINKADEVIEGTIKTGAYNPNLSMDIGNGLGKLNGKSINVSEKGLNLVKNHISQFGDIPENQAMINRIESALKNGHPITGADASFYMHEAAEATMMQKGISYEVAHEAVLQKYNVSPYSVYHPEVIQQFSEWFNQGFKNFWGLK